VNAFENARVARDKAKAALTQRLSLVRNDLDTRSIGGRIADKAVGETADVALEAIEIVESHKVVVGGTLAAIVLWFARNPLIAIIRRGSDRIKAIFRRGSRRTKRTIRRGSRRARKMTKGVWS
jgi:hypothetical protein